MAYQALDNNYQASPGSAGAYDRLLRNIEDEFEQLERYQRRLNKANDHGTPKPSEVHEAYVGKLCFLQLHCPCCAPIHHGVCCAAQVQPKMVLHALQSCEI